MYTTFHALFKNDQKCIKAANANVVPNDSLNATLSCTADRKSMLVTYFCMRV